MRYRPWGLYDQGHGAWHPTGDDHAMWVRLSTALPYKIGRWHHREGCPILSGNGCTCDEVRP